MIKLIPKNGYIIVKPIEEQEETYGNIVLPDLGKERPEIGEVLAVSSTFNWHTGEKVKSGLSVGDKVLIPKLGASRITLKGEEYFIVKEQDIYAVYDDSEGGLSEGGLIEAFEETKKGNINKDHYFVADVNKLNELNS